MAKKKKVTNNRGYATTSMPSKKTAKEDTTMSVQTSSALGTTDTLNTAAKSTVAASTTITATITTVSVPEISATASNIEKEQSKVEALVNHFKTLHDHKANLTFDKLTRVTPASSNDPTVTVKQPLSLRSELEQDIVNVVSQQQDVDTLRAFREPIQQAASQTEKDRMIGKMDILYLTLLKLGFEDTDIQHSFEATVSTDIEDHLDWLCLHVPYDRMPVGFYESYFSKEGVKASMKHRATMSSETGHELTDDSGRNGDDLVLLESKQAQSLKVDDDQKLRTLQAAQNYLYESEEEEDIELQHAKLKIELDLLESQVSDKSKKKKKNKLKANDPVLSDMDVDQARQNIEKLKQSLATLEEDVLFDKQRAHTLFVSELQHAANTRNTSQQDQTKSVNQHDGVNISEQGTPAVVAGTDTKDGHPEEKQESDDDLDMFGGMMDIMEDDAVATPSSTTAASVSSSVAWDIVDLSLPAGWKGRMPKQMLEEYCKPHGFVKQHYSRSNKGSSIWQASVSLTKRNMSESPVVVNLPDGLATEKPVDAEQLVAAVALFRLDPKSSIYQVMPAPFKDLWQEWKNKKMIEDEAPRLEADRKRIQFIMDIIDSSSNQSPKTNSRRISNDAMSATGVTEERRYDDRSLKRRRVFNSVQERFNKRLNSPFYSQMKAKRADLPIAEYREKILEMVQLHQVVIISGETGCGKSTQVPQFLTESLLVSENGYGSVICTQPRRISAMSIAQRVSKEMGDKPQAVGSKEAMVGYQIRLESKVSDENVLMFCTTGILLRRLESDPWLDGVSHVIVDEVHERSIDSDFLLIVLRRLCRSRSDLRVILMSATMNAERFSHYLGDCPVISVPGRTFPVKVQYLEDIIESTDYVLEEDSYYAIKRSRFKANQGNINVSGQHGSMKRVHYEIFDDDSEDELDNLSTNTSKLTIASLSEDDENEGDADNDKQYSRQTRKMIKRMDENKINYDLIVALLEHIYTQSNSQSDDCDTSIDTANDNHHIPSAGAILIFLPGMPEIRRLYDLVSMHSTLGDPRKTLLIALHSTLSSEHQEKAFDIPPEGIRKIVLATNIAETGITISDVTIVIDCGMAKIVSYDQEKRITRLKQMFVAKANVNQRKGRAGRVQEGLCYHLFTEDKYNKLADYETPEILRLPLEELCLRIKVCNLGSIEQVLESALDAPSTKMVKNAIQTLQEVEALAQDESETLTPLGAHLANLPVDVHIGKMILFGAIFRCLDPILTIAAALSFKTPFIRPFGSEYEADKAREQFTHDGSDFLTIYKAYCAWRDELIKVRQGSGWQRKISQFCKARYLSHKNLETIEEMKKQYLELLISSGFVRAPKGSINELERYDLKRATRLCQLPPLYNQYGNSVEMINAAITAGLYPKVALYNPETRTFMKQGTLGMSIHPSSTLFKKQQQLSSDFLVYNTVVMSNDKVYLWEASTVDAVTVMLLANNMAIKHYQKTVIVDNWLSFKCYARTAVLIKFLRYELKKWLQDKMDDPSLDLTTATETVMRLLVKTLENGH